MTARVIPLACQDDAARVATTDRAKAADLRLATAVVEAIDLIRTGHPAHARFVLERARLSADRILGGAS